MKNLLAFMGLICLLFIASCGPSGAVVKVRPQAPAYIHTAPPGAGYVWVDGDWFWQRNHYVYQQGYYIKARPHRATYIQGHWQRRGNGWIWIKGRWR